MKIIHCISTPGAGGAEIYVKDLALTMVEEGHAVHICFLSHAEEVGRDKGFEKLFLKELIENNIEFSFVGNEARRKPWRGLLHLRKLAKDFKADIVHCHLYYMAIFSLGVKGPKVIYTHHNIKLNAPRVIYKLLDLKVQSYVGICKSCTNLLNTVTKKSVVRIDNAVNEKKLFKINFENNPTASNTKRVKVLMVGGLAKQKNYSLLLNAVSLLKDLDFEVVIAGEGPLRDAINEEIDKLQLQNKVLLIGNCSDVPKLLSEVDIFAMSSSWEGLPISLLEATLTKLPVLVTNVGGCSEVVHHCQNGIVIDDLEPISYARGLRQLIESKERRTFYSKNAIDNSAIYTIQYSGQKHLQLYGKK